MKKKTPNVVPVEVKGLPNTVKVGYRDIKIKYVRPDFKTDDMTDVSSWISHRSQKQANKRAGLFHYQEILEC